MAESQNRSRPERDNGCGWQESSYQSMQPLPLPQLLFSPPYYSLPITFHLLLLPPHPKSPLHLGSSPCGSGDRAGSPPKFLLVLFEQRVISAHAVPLPVDTEHVPYTEEDTGAAYGLPSSIHLMIWGI
jgi:hypothetical protein